MWNSLGRISPRAILRHAASALVIGVLLSELKTLSGPLVFPSPRCNYHGNPPGCGPPRGRNASSRRSGHGSLFPSREAPFWALRACAGSVRSNFSNSACFLPSRGVIPTLGTQFESPDPICASSLEELLFCASLPPGPARFPCWTFKLSHATVTPFRCWSTVRLKCGADPLPPPIFPLPIGVFFRPTM